MNVVDLVQTIGLVLLAGAQILAVRHSRWRGERGTPEMTWLCTDCGARFHSYDLSGLMAAARAHTDLHVTDAPRGWLVLDE